MTDEALAKELDRLRAVEATVTRLLDAWPNDDSAFDEAMQYLSKVVNPAPFASPYVCPAYCYVCKGTHRFERYDEVWLLELMSSEDLEDGPRCLQELVNERPEYECRFTLDDDGLHGPPFDGFRLVPPSPTPLPDD